MVEFYEMNDEENVPYRCDVELDLIGEAPQEERPWLLWLFVKTDDASEKAFSAFVEDMKETLSRSINAVYAGSVFKEGWYEFYFYAPEAKKFENLSSDVMNRHGGFAYERGASRDGKWEMYLERLYPDGYGILRIQNRHTIESLLEAGDDLNVSREVEHYLFFQTKSAMERTVWSLTPYGFDVKEYVMQDESDYAYGAVLIKNEAVTPENVEETTAMLYEAALEQHGYYEGWSTVLA